MMAENTVLEQQFCRACGADVRPQALFCYSCGEAVSSDANGGGNVSDAWFRESLDTDAKTNNLSAEKLNEASEKIEKPAEPLEEKPLKTAKSGKKKAPIIKSEENLKTAASLNRQPRAKTFRKKKVEVVWEEPESPNAMFLLITLIAALLAGGVLFLMLWIR